MNFAIAVHGTRGDVEPAAALALELQGRGHEVMMAVPPNLVGFTRSAGLPSVVAYGRDSQQQLEAELFRKLWTLRNPFTVLRQARAYLMDGWAEMNETLTSVSADADLILTGTTYQEVAANVAEARGIPFAALHYFPARANTHILPVRFPRRWANWLWAIAEWGHWRLLKPAYDAQRCTLGLPVSKIRAARRIVDGGALEIQAYDRVFFPGLEEQWGGKRPLVGALTLELTTAGDAAVASWIAEGSPPVYFGFGSMSADHIKRSLPIITQVCQELGLRALICLGALPIDGIACADDIMLVPSVKHADVFPHCRAIVHHGGSGTTAASVRSGVPTLVLWVGADQPVWARQVKRLGVGTSRRLSSITADTLREDLQSVLKPACVFRAREAASWMTSPRQSVLVTADLIEARAAQRA